MVGEFLPSRGGLPEDSEFMEEILIKGKMQSNMKMIISTDFEARNLIVQLFFPFGVLFFCHLLLKYEYISSCAISCFATVSIWR